MDWGTFRLYKAVAEDAMALEDGNRSLCVVVVVVLDKIAVRHAILLLDVYSRLDDLPKASSVRVTCLKCLGYHVVT
jgi:hypothetical protein